jgi:hypothetical protein
LEAGENWRRKEGFPFCFALHQCPHSQSVSLFEDVGCAIVAARFSNWFGQVQIAIYQTFKSLLKNFKVPAAALMRESEHQRSGSPWNSGADALLINTAIACVLKTPASTLLLQSDESRSRKPDAQPNKLQTHSH